MKRLPLLPACAFLSCLVVSACSSGEATNDPCIGSGSSAIKVCATGTTLRGIDVSAYQGTVDWVQVKNHGTVFAFARASDGINTPDVRFAANWPAMKQQGIVRGVYQYFRPSQDPEDQAELLLAKVTAAGGFGPDDLPPVLDLETDSGLSAATVVARAKAWLSYMEARTGIKPIVYTANFMSSIIGTNFAGYVLWVANYQTSCPTIPSGWTNWQFWQDSETGAVPGIVGNVDTNHFNGDLIALKALTMHLPAPPTSVAPDTSDHPPLPNDGSHGATIGSGQPSTPGAPFTPCR